MHQPINNIPRRYALSLRKSSLSHIIVKPMLFHVELNILSTLRFTCSNRSAVSDGKFKVFMQHQHTFDVSFGFYVISLISTSTQQQTNPFKITNLWLFVYCTIVNIDLELNIILKSLSLTLRLLKIIMTVS